MGIYTNIMSKFSNYILKNYELFTASETPTKEVKLEVTEIPKPLKIQGYSSMYNYADSVKKAFPGPPPGEFDEMKKIIKNSIPPKYSVLLDKVQKISLKDHYDKIGRIFIESFMFLGTSSFNATELMQTTFSKFKMSVKDPDGNK